MLRVDYANCLAQQVGSEGLDEALLDADGPLARRAAEAVETLNAAAHEGMRRWRLLVREPARSQHVEQVQRVAAQARGRFDTVLLLGIGGSALGAAALHGALNPPTWNALPDAARPGPRLFVLDNVDPERLGWALEFVERHGGGLARTLALVVSKSGETAETAAQLLTLRDRFVRELGKEEHASHIVAVTDPSKGTLRRLCDEQGYVSLPVPEGVGGRFSALSPVGLLPAALVGIDIEQLLAGADEMDARCASPALAENPAAMLATLLVELGTRKGKRCHVMMPYSDAMLLFADWWRQLWAESLGKRVDRKGREVFAGFTPLRALGATDQHSQIQLYREGPRDKVVCFVEVESFRQDVAIPTGSGVEPLRYLEGSTFGALLNAEKRATEFALTASHRPNLTIRLPRVDARSVGQFIWLWQMATAVAGELLDVDAYDQPAVETGKKATFGLMGRRGYEEHRRAVEERLSLEQFCV